MHLKSASQRGWKAAVIAAVGCMNANPENALLKTLEEPPPKSVLLLRELPSGSGLDAARLAGKLKAILGAVEEELGVADEALDESKLKEILDARPKPNHKRYCQGLVKKIII